MSLAVRRFVLIALSGFLVSAVRADGVADRLEEYMKASAEADRFSGAVLVAKGNETLFARGYGLANAEHQVPNTPNTRFRLGSITKQFTAMAILILKERGKLELDDPIAKHLDDTPEAWKNVTVRHLLNHTSGIPSYTNDSSYPEKMMLPVTHKEMLARFRDKPLEFEPGSNFAYDNSGYYLLGMIIEELSGKSYAEFLQDEIFKPLGMNDTGYDRFETVMPRRAAGYERRGAELVNATYLDMSQPYAAGSLYSTVEDLKKWDRALAARKLISKDSYEAMWKPALNGYAFGWGIGKLKDHAEVSHGGGINGFQTMIARYPDDDVLVVVLSNVTPSRTDRIAKDLAAIALGEDYTLPKARVATKVDPSVFDRYAGKYELRPGFIITIRRDGDRLFALPTDQPEVELHPESKTRFFIEEAEIITEFVTGDDGKVSHMVVHQGGRETKAKRLENKSSDEEAKKTDRD